MIGTLNATGSRVCRLGLRNCEVWADLFIEARARAGLKVIERLDFGPYIGAGVMRSGAQNPTIPSGTIRSKASAFGLHFAAGVDTAYSLNNGFYLRCEAGAKWGSAFADVFDQGKFDKGNKGKVDPFNAGCGGGFRF